MWRYSQLDQRPKVSSQERELMERTEKHAKVKRQRFRDGRVIGPCVAAVLDYLGVPNETYIYTSVRGKRKLYEEILEKNGYTLVKDMRVTGKSVSVALRELRKLGYTSTDRVIILSSNKSKAHILLVNGAGQRIIDTAPRVRHKVEELVKVSKR
jgi:hypothetical protein